MCERELETEQNCNILTRTLLAITAFLSRSPGLLNRRPEGPASVGHVPQSSIFSPTGLIPNWLIGGLRAPSAGCWLSLQHLVSNWLNFLCIELYNSSTTTFFLWVSQIALIQPIHGQGYTLLFLDRMRLLFTPMHFLFWPPDRVVSQYTQRSRKCFCVSGFLRYLYMYVMDIMNVLRTSMNMSISHVRIIGNITILCLDNSI